MQTSDLISELATALAKAQGAITGALKDSANPFFKSKYADLASCWDACREPLSVNGLSVVQLTEKGEPVTVEWDKTDQKTGEVTQYRCATYETVIVTMLMHSSGQYIRSALALIPREISEMGIGACITYGRRYGLAAMLGIAQVDQIESGDVKGGKVAYVDPHRPQSDVSSIAPSVAREEAEKMRKILQLDIEPALKALKVLDLHDVINKDQLMYQAASLELSPKERNDWRAYVVEAKRRERDDLAVTNAKRTF